MNEAIQSSNESDQPLSEFEQQFLSYQVPDPADRKALPYTDAQLDAVADILFEDIRTSGLSYRFNNSAKCAFTGLDLASVALRQKMSQLCQAHNVVSSPYGDVLGRLVERAEKSNGQVVGERTGSYIAFSPGPRQP